MIFDDMNPLIPNPDISVNNSQARQDAIALMFSGMISMPDVSKLILQNGKQAVAALIIAMASASKQGISNEQIQETLSIINSCISMAESNNPAQSLKSLMMLLLLTECFTFFVMVLSIVVFNLKCVFSNRNLH